MDSIISQMQTRYTLTGFVYKKLYLPDAFRRMPQLVTTHFVIHCTIS